MDPAVTAYLREIGRKGGLGCSPAKRKALIRNARRPRGPRKPKAPEVPPAN